MKSDKLLESMMLGLQGKLPEDKKEESNTGNIYRIMVFVNTACAERRQYVDENEFEEDCLEIKEVFNSDIDCFKYIEDMYDLDLDIEEPTTQAYIDAFEDLNSDPGFGSVLILSIDGPNGNIYDSGMTFEDFEPESYLED